MIRPILTLLNLVFLTVSVDSFVVITKNHDQHGLSSSFLPTRKIKTSLASSIEEEEKKAIQCFIVNAFEVDEEGAEPQIICTAEPDEYAWFNGLERDHMMPAQDTTVSGEFLECIEGASPRGVPEWECKKKTIEESVWE